MSDKVVTSDNVVAGENGVRHILVNGEPLRIVIERAPFPWRKILTALTVLAVLYALSLVFEKLHEVVIMLGVAGLVAFILEPLVHYLERKMPRALAIALTYVGLIVVMSMVALSILPEISKQVNQMTQNMPMFQARIQEYTARVNAYRDKIPDQLKNQIEAAQTSLQGWSKEMLGAFTAVLLAGLGWLGKGMIILVLSIYLLLDKDRIREGLISLVPIPARAETLSVVGDVLVVIRSYLRGQIVVIGFVAITVTGALLLIGMPYWAAVGALAGILEVIPYFGAFVGAIPGVIYAFVVLGPLWGFGMIGFFIAINQIEGHVVIPLVMGANLEMRPIVVLLSLLVGHQLGGIVGLIVAVPVCRILQVFVEHGIQIYKDLRNPGSPMREPKKVIEGPVESEPGVATALEAPADDVKKSAARESMATAEVGAGEA